MSSYPAGVQVSCCAVKVLADAEAKVTGSTPQ